VATKRQSYRPNKRPGRAAAMVKEGSE
jgi:hypothetical protein